MNRETYPSNLFPLRGDLSAEAGATTVEVVGLQNIAITANPLVDGYVPTYVAADGEIEWRAGGGTAVKINGVGVSADKQFFIDAMTDGSAPAWTVTINGTADGG